MFLDRLIALLLAIVLCGLGWICIRRGYIGSGINGKWERAKDPDMFWFGITSIWGLGLTCFGAALF